MVSPCFGSLLFSLVAHRVKAKRFGVASLLADVNSGRGSSDPSVFTSATDDQLCFVASEFGDLEHQAYLFRNGSLETVAEDFRLSTFVEFNGKILLLDKEEILDCIHLILLQESSLC